MSVIGQFPSSWPQLRPLASPISANYTSRILGFASHVVDAPPSKPVLSAEEIAQVKADLAERQKRQAELSREEEAEKGKCGDEDGGTRGRIQ